MMVKYYILDADNHVVETDMVMWGRFFGRLENRVVGWTQVNSEIEVSTVFLGLDHRFVGSGPPILFETMVFGGPEDDSVWRYSSYDDAVTGHAATVKRVRAAVGQRITGDC